MGPGRLHAAVSWAAAVVLSVGCNEAEKAPLATQSAPTATTATGSTAARSAKSPPQSNAENLAPTLPTLPTQVCRVLTVTGSVRDDADHPVLARAALGGETWLELDPGASISVKHAKTAREVRFHGPGRALPCYQGGEVFLLQRGRVETTFGLGARAGAEVLLATPFGVVSYGDATLNASVTDSSLEVLVRQGEAWLEGTAADEAPEKIEKGKKGSRVAAKGNVKALLTRCEKAAEESARRARDVLDRNADKSTLGARAAAHLRARQSARKACGIAAAALGEKPPNPNHADLQRSLQRADARWQRIPGRRAPQKTEVR